MIMNVRQNCDQGLPIKVVGNKLLNCYENIIATLSHYWGRNYLFMFSHSWDFKFRVQEKDILGNGFFQEDFSQDQLVEEHLGIRSTDHHFDNVADVINCVITQTRKGYPVCIGMDAFICPWHPLYGIEHLLHYFLAVNYDEVTYRLHFVDPSFPPNCSWLEAADIKYIDKHCITFLLVEPFSPEPHWRMILLKALKQSSSDKIFDNMRCFARVISKNNQLIDEIRNFPANAVPMYVVNLSRIYAGRIKFYWILQYFSQECRVNMVDVPAERLLVSANGWEVVKNLFLRARFAPTRLNLLDKIANKILDIANEEESIATVLSECAEKGGI
jgi:hypothetical protein